MTTVGEWVAEKIDALERPGRIERAARELARLARDDWDGQTDQSRDDYRACAALILDAADGEEVRP